MNRRISAPAWVVALAHAVTLALGTYAAQHQPVTVERQCTEAVR